MQGGGNFSERILALWDTGATGSVILKEIADKLHLPVIGFGKVATAGGVVEVPFYYIDVLLPNNVIFPKLRVSQADALGLGVNMLVGMDIISKGDFAISNFEGKTTFTFRVPSLMEFDFEKKSFMAPNVKTEPAVGANSPCPCGSGKKYKQCCGKV